MFDSSAETVEEFNPINGSIESVDSSLAALVEAVGVDPGLRTLASTLRNGLDRERDDIGPHGTA